LFAREMPCWIASSKLLSDDEMISVTLATDMHTSLTEAVGVR
jgi:hypothetical protein